MHRHQNGANCLDCLGKTNAAIEYTCGTNHQRTAIINVLIAAKAPLDKLTATFYFLFLGNQFMETVYNRRRINVISWLSYFFTGGLVSTLGIVIGPVATAFNKDPAFIGLMFSLMNIGLFLPIMISGILMRKFDLGKQLITGSIVTILTLPCSASAFS
jgi:energy-converting hydrogenase Eha subunit C